MYPYLVHIMRKKIQEMSLNVPDPTRPGRNIAVSFFAPYKGLVEFDFNRDQSDYSDAETWHCRTQQEAELLAAKFAKDQPGSQVLVLELKAVAQAPASPVQIASWSEKGLVPR